MPRRALATVLVTLALLMAGPAHAQEPGDGAGLIHVVQRGESLYRIAQRYGVTVDDLTAANDIADPRRIYPGQELRIPNAGAADAGTGEALVTHVVQPGDTLLSLSYRYATTADRVAELNNLVNGTRLYVGQALTIAQGSAGASPVQRGRVHTVIDSDTLLSLARHYGVDARDISRVNALSSPAVLYPGQRLIIPGGPDDESAPLLRELPDPLLSLSIDPLPAVQGQTIGMRAQTSRPATVTGAFMGRPIAFNTSDGLNHTFVFGIHPLTARGLYPFIVFVRDTADYLAHLSVEVLVVEGNYGREVVPVSGQLQALLDESVTQPELARLASVMTIANPERYWGEGVFHRPVAQRVTSYFGTRRSYGGLMDGLHAGVDFGSPIGTPIYAPAPGRVVLAEQLAVRGNATIIDHGWGVYSGFWHQSQLGVAVGQTVEAGDLVGYVGNTGLSTGAHLHWEMWVSGVPVDPLQWLERVFP